MESGNKPLVTIVGRPNVGKSTLFNRLIGAPKAIVSEISGTTRDRVITETTWGKHTFILVDTGGLEEFSDTELWSEVRTQIHIAIRESDIVILLVDANDGLTPGDMDISNTLRLLNKPSVLAVNKADNDQRELSAVDFYNLGLSEPLPISAYHNRGIDELMSRVITKFPTDQTIETQDADFKLAVVGRPNVGKSMLLNTITEQNRAIVSEIPGTTRDTVDTLIKYHDQTILFIDTAGLRRRGKIEQGIEKYSTLRSVKAIDRAQVVILLMDATELATSQDTHISNYILEAHKGIVLAINKWDLANQINLKKHEAIRKVQERFNFASHAPICFVSALHKSGTENLVNEARAVHQQWNMEIPRYDLRRTVLNSVSANPPASTGRHALKLYGVTQDQSGPPSFTFYVNRSDMVHFSYKRYLENSLRGKYGFEGCPLKMVFKGRGEKPWIT